MLPDIPKYKINESLIRAIRRNAIHHLDSYFTVNPFHIGTCFLHFTHRKDMGIFENLVNTPTRLILTPLGYAVFFNSLKSVNYLLKIGSDPEAKGLIIDYPIKKTRLRGKINLFRMIDFNIVCLAYPNTKVFRKLVSSGLKLSAVFNIRFRKVTKDEFKQHTDVAYGIWELLWLYWYKFKDPHCLLDTTKRLLRYGANANIIMERVNLDLVIKTLHGQNNENNNISKSIFSIDILTILITNGCDIDELQLTVSSFKWIKLLLIDKEVKNKLRSIMPKYYKLIQSVVNLSPKFRALINDSVVLSIPHLNLKEIDSLELAAIKAVRKSLTGVLFVDKLLALRINKTTKESIAKGLPICQLNPPKVNVKNESITQKQ